MTIDTTTPDASSRPNRRRKSKARNGAGPRSPQPTPTLVAPKRERETRYSEAVMDEILRRISHGETLTKACASNPEFPAPSTVIDWVHQNRANIAERYAHARDRQIEAWSDQILDKADEALKNPETAHAARLAVDARKFLLSKLKPEVYGDRVELTGAGGRDLIPASSSLEWLRKVLGEPAASSLPLEVIPDLALPKPVDMTQVDEMESLPAVSPEPEDARPLATSLKAGEREVCANGAEITFEAEFGKYRVVDHAGRLHGYRPSLQKALDLAGNIPGPAQPRTLGRAEPAHDAMLHAAPIDQRPMQQSAPRVIRRRP